MALLRYRTFGAGIPVDFNKAENEYNWKLLFCEMYAGGKYDDEADNYEYSLGLNVVLACVQLNMLLEYMDAEIHSKRLLLYPSF